MRAVAQSSPERGGGPREARWRGPVVALSLMLAACTATTIPPGTGWSRAPDLSAYSAMVLFADIVREQSVLCGGFSPGAVAQRWRQDFGARETAIAAALAARHGAEAVARAENEAVATHRVPCPTVPNLNWRYRYGRMLRLLEARLGRA